MLRTVNYRTASLVIAFTAILGLALPAAGGDAEPFKGHQDAVVIEVEPETQGFEYTLAATGQATHLGRFAAVLTVVLQADGSFEGTQVFVAANGDVLYAEVEGAFISAIDLVGTYTFTGGTGRFSHASGKARLVGVSPDATHASFKFEGTISF
jgi:hypothetical protein